MYQQNDTGMKTFFRNNSSRTSSKCIIHSDSARINDNAGCTQTESEDQDEHIDGLEKVLVIISVLLFLILNS